MPDIAIFSGDRAANYNRFVSQWIPVYQRVIDYIPGLLEVHVAKTKDPIVVVGCGSGNELAAINQKHPEWQLLGIDPSPEMVVQAREKLQGRENVQILDARIEDLEDYPQFRAATLLLVLHFIPDDGRKLDLLKEIGTRLKVGAPLVIFDIHGDPATIDQQLTMLRGILLSENVESAIDDRLAAIKERIQYISEDRLSALLIEAGFAKPQRFFQAAIYGGWIATKAV
ncbi:MAG: class I SAM-dependent methyltransferase [Bacteroidota bacterium]